MQSAILAVVRVLTIAECIQDSRTNAHLPELTYITPATLCPRPLQPLFLVRLCLQYLRAKSRAKELPFWVGFF